MSSSGGHHYKRSQVEQAIVAIEAVGGTPAGVQRANVKRLLDFDRNPDARLFDRAPDTSAFFDGPPPGQGAEIAYRPYQAFALLVGVRLLKGGMPQSRVVLFLRGIRAELEPAFVRLMNVDVAELRPDLPDKDRSQRVRDGLLLQEAGAMTFLVVQAGAGAEPLYVPGPDPSQLVSGNICGAETLLRRLAYFSQVGQAAIVVELTNAVHQLMEALPHTTVRKRGRQ